MNAKGSVVEVDPITAALLDDLAKSWGVTREEVIRRALRKAKSGHPEERLRALAELQDHLGLTADKARAWLDAVFDARR